MQKSQGEVSRKRQADMSDASKQASRPASGSSRRFYLLSCHIALTISRMKYKNLCATDSPVIQLQYPQLRSDQIIRYEVSHTLAFGFISNNKMVRVRSHFRVPSQLKERDLSPCQEKTIRYMALHCVEHGERERPTPTAKKCLAENFRVRRREDWYSRPILRRREMTLSPPLPP